MPLITGSWLVDLSIVFIQVLLTLYLYFTWTFDYWKKRNVPFAKPVIGMGSLGGLLEGKSHPEVTIDIYKQFDGERYCGLFQFRQPSLMIRDPKLIEQIMIKDFIHFEDRPLPINPKKEPLTVNLVNLKGKQWRNLRYKLTPTFTSGKLKGMFQQMCNCGEKLLHFIDRKLQVGEAVDVKTLISTFSTDTIVSCAFGLQMDSEGPQGKEFMEMVDKAIGGKSRFAAITLGVKICFPELAKLLGLRSMPSDAEKYFIGLTKATIAHRLKENIHREDFLQMLLTLKEKDEAGKPDKEILQEATDQEDIQLMYEVKPEMEDTNLLKFTEELIAAQSFVFLAAGAESTSNSLSIVFHYIAEHPHVQSRLQAELDTVLAEHGSCTYQALQDMTYLDQVIQESQRIFPIANVHVRTCTIPYHVPDSNLVIEKGVQIIIPAHALQTDPAYYPDPETFNPDRFKNNNFKPSSIYSPFGDGPRICIAIRFAVLEMKVCVVKILSKYNLELSPKTVTPLRYDPQSANLRVLKGVWLSFHPREI